MPEPIQHGGGLDRAMARYGGARADWLDLSTGINP
ncbi:MAG: threonine-phosphate decarboxylase, partial [Ahrensia sp.]